MILLVASGRAGLAAGMEVSGYTQARYMLWADSMYKADEFDLRRVRVKFSGPINDTGTRATLQVDLSKLDETGSGSVGLKDAIVEQPLGELWMARLGFAPVLFGYEVPSSSSRRLPFERSHAARTLFPGERDTGLYLIREPRSAREPQIVLAFSNGLAEWEDEEQQAAVARLQWNLPNGGAAGVSCMTADRTPVDEKLSQDVWGAHVRWTGPGGSALQGELYDGTMLDVDVSGWYGQVEYAFPTSQWTGYYRYDTFDDGVEGH